MTDDELELFDTVEGRSGESEGATPEQGGDEPAASGGVDLTFLNQEKRDALSALPEEYLGVVAEVIRAEQNEIRGNADRKLQEAAKLRKDAEFGRSILENKVLLQRVYGLEEKVEPEPQAKDYPLHEMPLDTPEDRHRFVEAVKDMMGVQAQPDPREMINQVPEIQMMRLKTAATATRNQLASEGMKLSDAQWRTVTNAWTSAQSNPLAVDPGTLSQNLRSLAGILLSDQTVTSPNPGRPSAPSPSPGFTATTKPKTPWERENRAMTDQEIFEHGGGVSGDELQRALDAELGKI